MKSNTREKEEKKRPKKKDEGKTFVVAEVGG